MTGGGGPSGPSGSSDSGSGGFSSLLSGSIAGIPIWILAAGLGAVLLLKKR